MVGCGVLYHDSDSSSFPSHHRPDLPDPISVASATINPSSGMTLESHLFLPITPHMPAYMRAKLLQSCLNLVTQCTVTCQGLLYMRFSRQEYWSGLPCFSPGDLPAPGNEPRFLRSLSLAGGVFTTSTTWEATHIPHHINYQAQPVLSFKYLLSPSSSLQPHKHFLGLTLSATP